MTTDEAIAEARIALALTSVGRRATDDDVRHIATVLLRTHADARERELSEAAEETERVVSRLRGMVGVARERRR